MNASGWTNEPTSFLETQWVAYFKGSEYPALRLATLFFLFHELVFIGSYLPYVVCDHTWLCKYKIQADKIVSDEQWWKCASHVLLYQVLFELPMMLAFHPVAMVCGMKFLQVPFPSWTESVLACGVFLIMEDFYQYFMHRLLHWGVFYKTIHKIHHEFSAPFGLASQYAHPIEILVLGLGFFVGPFAWMAFRPLHVITLFGWIGVRLLQVVESHSGYEFPWSIRKFIPFWAGADFHDYHHMAFVGNYASSFRWWDAIMGTDAAYQKLRLRKDSIKEE